MNGRIVAENAADWPGDGDEGALRGDILQYVSGDVGCVGWLIYAVSDDGKNG